MCNPQHARVSLEVLLPHVGQLTEINGLPYACHGKNVQESTRTCVSKKLGVNGTLIFKNAPFPHKYTQLISDLSIGCLGIDYFLIRKRDDNTFPHTQKYNVKRVTM